MRLLNSPQMPSRQQGATLAVALIFLVILTLLGLSAMSVTTMEERMSGNTRDHNLAFQGAETALRDAEGYLLGKDFYAFDASCTIGLCAQGSAPDRTLAATWSGAKVVQSTTSISGLSAQPRYFTEYAGQVKCAACAGGWASAYRITTRSLGGNANTQVFLEEVYRP